MKNSYLSFTQVVKYNKSKKILHALGREMTHIQNRQMKNIFEIIHISLKSVIKY